MRTFLLSFALMATAAFTQAQTPGTPTSGKGPMISLSTEDIDYGTIKQGADGDRQFTVTNTGDAPLIMARCQGSCGCTVPKCDTAPIAPGQNSVVNVHYDTNRVGAFSKTVTVTSNAANAPSKVVTIHGTVEAVGTPNTPPARGGSGAGGSDIPPAVGDPREVND